MITFKKNTITIWLLTFCFENNICDFFWVIEIRDFVSSADVSRDEKKKFKQCDFIKPSNYMILRSSLSSDKEILLCKSRKQKKLFTLFLYEIYKAFNNASIMEGQKETAASIQFVAKKLASNIHDE